MAVLYTVSFNVGQTQMSYPFFPLLSLTTLCVKILSFSPEYVDRFSISH